MAEETITETTEPTTTQYCKWCKGDHPLTDDHWYRDRGLLKICKRHRILITNRRDEYLRKEAEAFKADPNRVIKYRKKNKPRGGQSIRKVDIEKVHKSLLNVLARDTAALLEASHLRKLNKEEATALTQYLKLIREIKKADDDELDTLSDEELEKLAEKK